MRPSRLRPPQRRGRCSLRGRWGWLCTGTCISSSRTRRCTRIRGCTRRSTSCTTRTSSQGSSRRTTSPTRATSSPNSPSSSSLLRSASRATCLRGLSGGARSARTSSTAGTTCTTSCCRRCRSRLGNCRRSSARGASSLEASPLPTTTGTTRSFSRTTRSRSRTSISSSALTTRGACRERRSDSTRRVWLRRPRRLPPPSSPNPWSRARPS
mmetsp:Transcript_49433/g.128951  ORF Transcript_49433/g.128951 Transcript_49433/m.128951 type:complete len:211 (+) Transcript_49433:547-1179(+)